jgi:uncharacterized protein YaaN involved in tellurite resistance
MSMTTTTTAVIAAVTMPAQSVSPLILTPPDIVPVVQASQVTGLVELSPERKAKLDEQLNGFMDSLLGQDLSSDAFRTRLDQAFSLGRTEIAKATTLTNAFTNKNFAGEADTQAYQAISKLRVLFDDLNPAKQGDLFSPTKILGIKMPFGNKLQQYLRRYESAGTQINALHDNILQAKDEVQKGVVELGLVRTKVWDNIGELEAVEYFISTLDAKLSEQTLTLSVTDPSRAKALESEVLYYVRQTVGDVLATKALCVNSYNVFGELRKTGREVMNGCDRVATMGMAALSLAVTMTRATGAQVKTMEMLQGSKSSIEGLIASTGDALVNHAKLTAEFSANPILGVETLQGMFDKTMQAMDTMDNFRTQAMASMQTNNNMVRAQLTTQMARISVERRVTGEPQGIAL